MSDHLPPDLDRLGDALQTAAQRRARRRARRVALATRLATAGAAGAVAIAVLSPGPLGSADDRGLLQLASSPATVAGPQAACDQPRRATFSASSPCSGSSLVLLRRAYAP